MIISKMLCIYYYFFSPFSSTLLWHSIFTPVHMAAHSLNWIYNSGVQDALSSMLFLSILFFFVAPIE